MRKAANYLARTSLNVSNRSYSIGVIGSRRRLPINAMYGELLSCVSVDRIRRQVLIGAVCTFVGTMLSSCAVEYSAWAAAANNRDTQSAKTHILNEKELESTDLREDTPLLWAARNAQADVVEFLIDNKLSDVNEANRVTGETALILAAKNGQKELAEFLIFRGAMPNARDGNGHSALDWAAQQGRNDMYNFLAARLSSDSAGIQTNALVSAAHSSSLKTVKSVIRNGADINAPDTYGDTALGVAAKTGNIEIAQHLLEHNADRQAPDRLGRTPLILAVQAGHVDVVALLIADGADVAQQHHDGYSALAFAAANGQEEMVNLLLANGARPDTTSQEPLSKSALLVAAQAGHTGVVVQLIAHGANVDARSTAGDTALMFAAANGNAGIVDLLLQNGASPNIGNLDGLSPLYLASLNGHWYITEQLLTAGIDLRTEQIAAINDDPRTAAPLYEIAGRHYLKVGNKESAVEQLTFAKTAYLDLAKSYRRESRSEKLGQVFAILGTALLVSTQTYLEQEQSRMAASDRAEIEALATSRSPDEYFAGRKDLNEAYARAISIDEKAKYNEEFSAAAIRQPTSENWGPDRLSRLSEIANQDSERIERALECIRASGDDEQLTCLAATP